MSTAPSTFKSELAHSPDVQQIYNSMKESRVLLRKRFVDAYKRWGNVKKEFVTSPAQIAVIKAEVLAKTPLSLKRDAQELKDSYEFLQQLDHSLRTTIPLVVAPSSSTNRLHTDQLDGHAIYHIKPNDLANPNDIEFCVPKIQEVWAAAKHAFQVTLMYATYTVQHEDGNTLDNLEKLQQMINEACLWNKCSHEGLWVQHTGDQLIRCWRFDPFETACDLFIRIDADAVYNPTVGYISFFLKHEIHIDMATLSVTCSIPFYRISPKHVATINKV